MTDGLSSIPSSPSLFRTRAWVQSWMEIWGNHPRIKLIDIGGRGDPLEMLYLIDHKLKGIIPVTSLVLAGYGFADFDPPRAEYNNLDSLIRCSGSLALLMGDLEKLSWDQWAITDICETRGAPILRSDIEKWGKLHCTISRKDTAYRIEPIALDQYKKQLSSPIRAKYFNRRSKLAVHGHVEIIDFTDPFDFFKHLNAFHLGRWGRDCYSPASIDFFSLFTAELLREGGIPVMQGIKVNNEVVSVLFDVIWNGMRYNLQSGYAEGRFQSLSLGSIHLGLAIEQALLQGIGYDFLAGTGKHNNYKEKISTVSEPMRTFCLSRGWLKYLYRIYGK
jgi:hypothetical protein